MVCCPKCGYCESESLGVIVLAPMARTLDYVLSDCNSFSNWTPHHYPPPEDEIDKHERAPWIGLTVRKFLALLAPQILEPNPLPILARAVNGLRLACRVIRQPCWRKTRFKAR